MARTIGGFKLIEQIIKKQTTLTKPVSIRVAPNSYLVVLFLSAFFSALIIYLGYDAAGFILLGLSLIILPAFAFLDRIRFDGKRISRTGTIPNAWAKFNRSRRRLKISDIEQVETHALRTMKRGGKISYRYSTAIRGKGAMFIIVSGGNDFRAMIQSILPLLPENVLDNRSMDLRDYISDPKELLQKANFSRIPSADVLENSLRDVQIKANRNAIIPDTETAAEQDKIYGLRKLANELRLSGALLQAIEAFRRALILRPSDAWLLFEFARCLQSLAGSESDGKLERKAMAMLRLAERRAGTDGTLLARLGESYFQSGEWRRAGIVFQRAAESVGESFRIVRGLAEIALREGKIAHVIHNFSAANRLAETPALRRWTQNEIEYFSRLNNDEEYMDMEISRVNLLDSLERSKKTTLRIAIFAFPVIISGEVFEDALVSNVGWAVSTVALTLWTGMILAAKMLSPRIPPELLEDD